MDSELFIYSLNSSDVVSIIFIVLLMCFSAFFSAAETAFSASSEAKIQVYAEQGKKGAKTAIKLISNYNKTLTTVLIGNNIVNIGMTTVATVLFARAIANESLSQVVSTAVMTITVLIFGEIMPKTLAKKHPEAFALKLSPIINFISIILTPFSIVFMGLQKALAGKTNETTTTEEELETIVEEMGNKGVIEDDEVELIHSVLDLNDREVSEIMVPRIDMVFISADADVDQIKKTFFEEKFSRIPVYQDDDKDKIIGILYERDFFTKLVKGQKINIKNLVRPAMYVSKAMKVSDLITEFQKTKTHMAIVSGEYGETAGLVTMEDALEELVGEIYDEHDDVAEKPIKNISENEYLVNADIDLEELFETLNVGHAPESNYSKLSGWLYDINEDIPQVGYQYKYVSEFLLHDEEHDYEETKKVLTFTIKEVEERRIKTVYVKVEDYIDEED